MEQIVEQIVEHFVYGPMWLGNLSVLNCMGTTADIENSL
ncbi:hypothetical protein ACN38_g12681, partial [Penicillium nordicum]